MSDIRLNIREYLNYIKMSHSRHLLVEGRYDKNLFHTIIDEIKIDVDNLRIDSAEHLVQTAGEEGNRELVEAAAREISTQSFSARFVGLVDREFRKFSVQDSGIQDELQEEFAEGRLLWTRGHSIENYFFDMDVLNAPLRDVTLSDNVLQALKIYENAFDYVMRVGCAISLSGMQLNLLKPLVKSANWTHFSVTADGLRFDHNKWYQDLPSHRVDTVTAARLLELFDTYHARLHAVSTETIRWLCHGHIGFSVCWSAFTAVAVCYTSSASKPNQAHLINKVNERIRFNLCATSWCRTRVPNGGIAPLLALEMLGITIPTRSKEVNDVRLGEHTSNVNNIEAVPNNLTETKRDTVADEPVLPATRTGT